MTDKKRMFRPEKLDQQIDEAELHLDDPAKQLVDDLRWLYQTPVAHEEANANSLHRVRQRLEERIGASSQRGNIISLQEARLRRSGAAPIYTSQEAGRSRWQRVPNAISGIVAVMVIATLVASLLILINARKDASTLSQKQVTLPATPTAKVDCSYTFASDYFGIDNGEHAACLAGEEKPLNLTTTIQGRRVTLISAYADTNRVFIRLAVYGVPPAANPLSIDKLIVQRNIILPLGPTNNIYFYDKQNERTLQLISFDASRVPADTTTLDIHEETTGFHFTIPFHPARRMATPKQQLSINGHKIIIKRVIVARSQTIIYMEPAETLPPSDQVNLEGTLNGKTMLVEASTTSQNNGKQGSVTGWYATVQQDFTPYEGNWTLLLISKGDPLGEGHAQIQFTVSTP